MHLALVALGYVVTAWTGLTAPQFPAHDNALYQLPTFLYYANALADGFGLPRWYPLVGGTPVIVSSPSLFPFLPHKWVGYALFALTDASPLRVYQLGLLSGVLLVLAGVWHLVRELTRSPEAATVAAFAVGASGAGATVWHQEQLLATITWYPWIALCAAKAARDARWLPLAAALFGITLGTHYPTIHLLTATAAVACVAALHRRAFVAWLRAVPRAVWMGAAAAFALGAAHLGWIFVHRGEFGSPVRQLTGSLGARTLAEYLAINTQQASSAPVAYLRGLLSMRYSGTDDEVAYFASPVALLLAAAGALRGRRTGVLLATLAAFSAWLSTGIYGGAAQALFTLRFPSVAYFRQWYHFAGPAMLWLGCLVGAGFAAATARLRARSHVLVAAMVVCALLVHLGRENFVGYASVEPTMRFPTNLRFPPATLETALRPEAPTPWIGLFRPGGLIAYASSVRASSLCTTESRLRAAVLPAGSVRGAPETLSLDACRAWMAGATMLPMEAMRVTPAGLVIEADLPPGDLLVPFDSRLGFTATLDGRAVPVGSAGEGAFSRVNVPGGRHRLAWTVGTVPHFVTLPLQALAAALGVFVLRRRRAA